MSNLYLCVYIYIYIYIHTYLMEALVLLLLRGAAAHRGWLAFAPRGGGRRGAAEPEKCWRQHIRQAGSIRFPFSDKSDVKVNEKR